TFGIVPASNLDDWAEFPLAAPRKGLYEGLAHVRNARHPRARGEVGHCGGDADRNRECGPYRSPCARAPAPRPSATHASCPRRAVRRARPPARGPTGLWAGPAAPALGALARHAAAYCGQAASFVV